MRIEWILSPLGQCVFLALAMVACLALFLSVKLEIAMVKRSFDKRRESEAASNATLAIELATLRGEMAGVEAPFTAKQELSASRREQALHMQIHGQAPEAIAAALRVPRNEIELLLKIQRLAQNDYSKQASSR